MYILSFDPNYVSWFKVFYITVLGIFELSLCPLALQIKPINYAFYAKKESKLFMPKNTHTHTGFDYMDDYFLSSRAIYFHLKF